MYDDTSSVLDNGLEYIAVKSHAKASLAVAFACAMPVLFREMSTCPWNLPELFQLVSPCRTSKIFNVYALVAPEIHIFHVTSARRDNSERYFCRSNFAVKLM